MAPLIKRLYRAAMIYFFAQAILVAHAATVCAQASFGAEDKDAEDNVPSIPEPMVFDLVRGLGTRQGEFEINCLAEFPLDRTRAPALEGFDPL
jgi:hypothetical protein